MNQTSVLGRYLWVFRRIVGRMQHDLFHVYTVDQHILMVLRNVRRFFIPEHAHEYPFCSQLAGHWDKPWVLYVARSSTTWPRVGAVTTASSARSRCAASAATTGWRRRHAADRVPGAAPPDDEPHRAEGGPVRPRRHRQLRRAGGHAAPADGPVPADGGRHPRHQPQGLERLEGQAAGRPVPPDLRALGGDRPNLDAEIEARKQEARQNLALHSALPGTEEPLWKTLEVSYFARHDAATSPGTRGRCGGTSTPRLPVVRARPSSVGDGLQVLVYSPDRRDLFARICGYFDSAGFSIQDAKIHTTRAGYALDTFQVVHATGRQRRRRSATAT
jgi:[protein-PII] uridylyltransferase